MYAFSEPLSSFRHVRVARIAICGRGRLVGRRLPLRRRRVSNHAVARRRVKAPICSSLDHTEESATQSDGADNGDDEEDSGGGGYQASFAANFHILLPYLSKNTNGAAESEETLAMRDFVEMLSDRYSSTHRFETQMENLRPFKRAKDAEHLCDACHGVGDVTCAYCGGEGFVEIADLDAWDPHFDGWELAPPRRAVGNYFHCPLCGGRTVTRCEACGGTGLRGGMQRIANGEVVDEPQPYAAGESRIGPATEMFDLDAFKERHKSRIEDDDGLIVLREEKPKRGRKAKKKADAPVTAEAEEAEMVPPKRKRGRPRKKRPSTDDAVVADEIKDPSAVAEAAAKARENGDKLRRSLSPGARGVSPKSRRSTDFLNTTDFQVGKRLSTPEAKGEETEKQDEGSDS